MMTTSRSSLLSRAPCVPDINLNRNLNIQRSNYRCIVCSEASLQQRDGDWDWDEEVRARRDV